MARGNFPNVLPVTLAYEGGWSDNPKDPGGATMKGITLETYRRLYSKATKAQLKAISDNDVRRIYSNDYWLPIHGEALPYGVDLATFDAGVNSGPSRAARWLQAAVGAKQDGNVGPATLTAVGKMIGKDVIQKLCAKRLGFVHGLKTWKTFGKGWSSRIANVEAKAVAMWLAHGTTASPESTKEILKGEADKAKSTADAQGKAGGAAAGGGGAVGGGDAIVNGHLTWIVIGVIAVLAVVAVAMVVKSCQNKQRAAAYAAVAGA